jgi:hypothetical protein
LAAHRLAIILLSLCLLGIFAGMQTEPEITLLDPKSNPQTVLFEKFLASGWSSEQAAYFSHQLLGKDWGLPAPSLEPPATTAADTLLLDPKSNPWTVLYEAFLESGWSSEEASAHAHQALKMAVAMDTCIVYPVRIIYCSGENRHLLSANMPALCWEGPGGDDGLNSCVVACTPGSFEWLNLTVEGTGCSVLPADGTCVSLRAGNATSVNCEFVDLSCSCFEETSPLNCSEIETLCCSSGTTGCAGCPNCN